MLLSRLRAAGALSLAILASLVAGEAIAQSSPPVVPASVKALSNGDPGSAIFIGNSFFYYNNGITTHLTPMITAGYPGKRWRSTMATIGGSGFDWHDVASYFRPNAIGRYSFDANNNIVFNKLDRLFDVAIVMDCSLCPIHPEIGKIFEEQARLNAETIRKNGAEPVFFMSWAYADKPEMTAPLAERYTTAGNANKALVIPAGLAFARAIAERPSIQLYAPDKRHPSLAGTYLAAATTYAALFGKSPVGNAYTAGLDPDLAAFLQRAAWETVQGYLRSGT
jgi:hypothetical protein